MNDGCTIGLLHFEDGAINRAIFKMQQSYCTAVIHDGSGQFSASYQ